MPKFLGTFVLPKTSTAPTSPAVGQVYYDATGNRKLVWNGTQWKESQPDGGSVPVTTVSASGAAQTLNCGGGIVAYDVTETANCTYTFTGAVSGFECIISLTRRQDATASRLCTFPTTVVWANGYVPPFNTRAGRQDTFVFRTTNGGTTWEGSAFVTNCPSPGVPSKPLNLTGEPANNGAVLSWNVPDVNFPRATAFKLQRKTGTGGTFIDIPSTGVDLGDVVTYSDTTNGIANGSTYYYRIAARNSYGLGVYSDESAAVTPSASISRSFRFDGTTSPASDAYITPGIGDQAGVTTGDTNGLKIIAMIRAADYTNGNQTICCQGNTWFFYLNGTGNLVFDAYLGGTTSSDQKVFTSTAPLSVVNGTDISLRVDVRYNDNDGSVQANMVTVRFYTTTDNPTGTPTWTQLGTSVVKSVTGASMASGGGFALGALNGGTGSAFSGRIYYIRTIGFGASYVETIRISKDVRDDTSSHNPGSTTVPAETPATINWTLRGTAFLL